MLIRVKVNGVRYEKEAPPSMTLLQFIREVIGLTGTKEGCGAGECGACTVIMNGRTVNSCLVLAAEADGAEIETIEGEAEGGELSPLQKSLRKHNAVQCGFCTPGMIMTLREFLIENPKPTEEEVLKAIEGNFCRCTGYRQIVEAVMDCTGQNSDGGDLKYV